MSRRLAGFISAYLRAEPTRLALIVLCVAIVVIVASMMYVVRYGHPAHQPVPRGTSQSACPSPPQGYSPCDPIPTNTGFQTGDVG
jgi:flagellar basal body-associated protein FliL